MEVDPIFYVTQVLFFVWGAILLGFFVKDLITEVQLNGWRTSRCLWVICLCISATMYVILQLDPRGILGLYSPAGLKLIEWFAILSAIQSTGFTGYIYLVAMYLRNSSPIPPFLRNYWLGFNVSLTFVHITLSAVGAITDNLFWFGVDLCFLVLHEGIHIAVLNVCICTLSRYLHKLTEQQSAIGLDSNFRSALRKMMYVRIGSIVIYSLVAVYQIFGNDGIKSRLSAAPILRYQSTTFEFNAITGILLMAILHMALLYMLRRPQSSAKASQRSISRSPKEPTEPTSTTTTESRPSFVIKVEST